jgi:hypothetical protein
MLNLNFQSPKGCRLHIMIKKVISIYQHQILPKINKLNKLNKQKEKKFFLSAVGHSGY